MIYIINLKEEGSTRLVVEWGLRFNSLLRRTLYNKFTSSGRYNEYCHNMFPESRCNDGDWFNLNDNPSRCVNLDVFYDKSSEFGSEHKDFLTHQALIDYRIGFEDWFRNTFIGKIIPAFRNICPSIGSNNTMFASLDKMSATKVIIDKPEEWMPELEELTGSEVLIGNKIYRLNPVADVEANSIINRTKNRYKKIAKKHSTELLSTLKVVEGETERHIKTLEMRMKGIQRMPEVNLNDYFRSGIGVVKNAEGVTYILPFKYQPKFIDFKNMLSDEHIKICNKKVLIAINVIKEMVVGTKLLKSDGDRFDHYHLMDARDCLGDYKFSKVVDTKSIIKIRDDVQKLLQNINTHSLGRHTPVGLPSSGELQEGMVALKKEEIEKNGWFVKSEE